LRNDCSMYEMNANMNIKKHPNGNEYIRAGDTWVRNFTKPEISPLQITDMFDRNDLGLILKNQQLNKNFPRVSDEVLRFDKVLIISDGYDFKNKQDMLKNLPRDVCILATNGSLLKWKYLNSKIPLDSRRTINGFVINNPYKEAMNFLPKNESSYFPTCIASVRTNHEFLKKYKGNIYTYQPTHQKNFGTSVVESYYIDDYRNPICAAIGLAFRFGVKKLMLFCCDDSFENQRDNAVQLPNGLWTYKPLIRSHEIIDANLYWLTHEEDYKVQVADCSSGLNYANAAYINSEEEVVSFFTDLSEGVKNGE
jgi:hypothetical protein